MYQPVFNDNMNIDKCMINYIWTKHKTIFVHGIFPKAQIKIFKSAIENAITNGISPKFIAETEKNHANN